MSLPRPFYLPPRIGALLLLLLWVGTPVSGSGQGVGSDCDLTDFRVWTGRDFGGTRIDYYGGPTIVCPGGTRIQADSAVIYHDTGRNELIGNVRFQDAQQELQSSLADYFGREGRLFATGNVRFRELASGMAVRGDSLIYLEAGQFRPSAQLHVSGTRSEAILPVEGSPDPYQVTATQLRFEGDRFFWADGEVEVVREALRALADSLVFDREAGLLVLIGGAELDQEGVRLAGERMSIDLPNDRMESVSIFGGGSLLTEEVEVRGEEIWITLPNEAIEELLAIGSAGTGEVARLRSLADGLVMEGDSVRLLAPQQRLERIVASGRARAVTGGEAGEEDWIRSDWIEASFIPLFAAPERDPEAPLELSMLVARGSAAAWWRIPPGSGESELAGGGAEPLPRSAWPVSYVLADEIQLLLQDGAVERVDGFGSVTGVQAQPRTHGASPPRVQPEE